VINIYDCGKAVCGSRSGYFLHLKLINMFAKDDLRHLMCGTSRTRRIGTNIIRVLMSGSVTRFLGLVLAVTAVLGCNQKSSELEDRIRALEEKVNMLETVIAKSESAETFPLSIISHSSPQIAPEPARLKKEARKRSETKTNYQSYSGRCQATTKKGTQCKRSASAGSNYCWQH
jgi:hypothetical protein